MPALPIGEWAWATVWLVRRTMPRVWDRYGKYLMPNPACFSLPEGRKARGVLPFPSPLRLLRPREAPQQDGMGLFVQPLSRTVLPGNRALHYCGYPSRLSHFAGSPQPPSKRNLYRTDRLCRSGEDAGTMRRAQGDGGDTGAGQNVRYLTSQPWPFPHSLMMAFMADYDGGISGTIRMSLSTPAGIVTTRCRCSHKGSVARRLIEDTLALYLAHW